MKILLVRTWPTLLDVGKQTYNIQEVGLAKALMRRGHQVDLLFWTNEEEKDVLVPVAEGANIHVFYRHGPVALKCVFFPHMKKLAEQYDILQTGEYSQLYSWHLAGKYPDKTVIYHGPYYAPFNRNYNRLCWGILYTLFFALLMLLLFWRSAEMRSLRARVKHMIKKGT